LTTTASIPNVDVQSNVLSSCVFETVIVPSPVTTSVPFPFGSCFASDQVWPPPYASSRSAQALPMFVAPSSRIGVTDAAWTIAPGANSAALISAATTSQDSRRARRWR
jgi:hypothetical protein